MNRFAQYGEGDDQPVPDGDGGWVGVNMLQEPGRLASGEAAYARNKRFTNGVAATRKGTRILPWAARGYHGYGPGVIMPYGAVSGGGVFNDPISGESWLIIVSRNGVVRSRPGTAGTEMTIPTGTVFPARVQLIQTYSGMVMLRGPSLKPLYCDDLDVGWKELPEAANSPGNIAIPPASTGIYFQNRLFVVDGRPGAVYVDTIFVSDFGTVFDVLEGSVAYNQFKINVGSADRLKALYRFNDTTLIAAKERSIYVVTNVYGDNATLAQNARLDAVTTEYGCVAPQSFVQVGSDVWFLGHQRGVCSIRQTESNTLQGVDVPVSREVQGLVDRINWDYAQNAVAVYWDNKVYFAVPLDNPLRYGKDYSGHGVYPTVSGIKVNGLVPGATYEWTPGPSEVSLTNGTESITSHKIFTAQGGSVTIINLPEEPRTYALKRIWKGYNNALLVYDTLAAKWAGYDTSDAIMVRDRLMLSYGGTVRFGSISDDGFVRLHEDGAHDHIGTEDGVISYEPVQDLLVTRGYGGSVAGRKRFREARVTVSTWNPSISVTARVDGVREVRPLATGLTKDRTKWYRPWNRPDYAPTNTQDDFNDPFRKDYSIMVPPAGILVGDNGITPGVKQRAEEPFRLRESGQYVQLEIANATGQCDVHGVVVETFRGSTRQTTHA